MTTLPAGSFEPPDAFNIADYFLHDRVAEGAGDRTAIRCGDRTLTYREVQQLARRFGNALRAAGVRQEQRVIVALPDGPEFAAALFGILEIGAVVVMVNPYQSAADLTYFYEYTRAAVALVGPGQAAAFAEAAQGTPHLRALLVVPAPGEALGELPAGATALDPAEHPDALEAAPTHRDDAAIWLFSGGTTGKPKAVVQTHTAFANTTELYAKGVIGYGPDDVTLSVPKLFFGYATGSNLLFPFAVGATSVLFPQRCTPEELFAQIRAHQPTILINVPTMIGQLLETDPDAAQDLSCLRLATSAGEALPVALHERWQAAYGVPLLDGLGTAEMWHVFLSNRPDDCRPGTLGKVVPGFEVELRGPDGAPVAPGEIGALWVRGNSRAIGYWQQHGKTLQAFQGPWYVSGDQLRQDEDGYYVYCGRADDMLKVKGKWFAPKEVEDCLTRHAAVKEGAVIGVAGADGLTRPWAFVIPAAPGEGLEETLRAHVAETLASYKVPERFVVKDDLPRTHLGKINRGALRSAAESELQGAGESA